MDDFFVLDFVSCDIFADRLAGDSDTIRMQVAVFDQFIHDCRDTACFMHIMHGESR
ncbi:hypothetical protein SDC9_72255 [bioreactor metagenome]|uniref:Uncharacterized protein n=1 Tax=bioreactor metagenome TaxID=1076179 RepID=A0A644YB44_9ZZZZ